VTPCCPTSANNIAANAVRGRRPRRNDAADQGAVAVVSEATDVVVVVVVIVGRRNHIVSSLRVVAVVVVEIAYPFAAASWVVSVVGSVVCSFAVGSIRWLPVQYPETVSFEGAGATEAKKARKLFLHTRFFASTDGIRRGQSVAVGGARRKGNYLQYAAADAAVDAAHSLFFSSY